MSRFASEFTPATATAMWSANLCIFSDATPVSTKLGKGGCCLVGNVEVCEASSGTLERIFFSAARTTPELVRIPTAAPAWLIAFHGVLDLYLGRRQHRHPK